MSNTQTQYPLKLYGIWLSIGIGMMIFLTWSSLTPLAVKVITIKHSDLLLHLLAYGSTTFWFAQIFRGVGAVTRVAIFMLAYGLLMETAQGLLTLNRDANMLDVLANACGVFLGVVLSRILLPAGLFYRIETLVLKPSP